MTHQMLGMRPRLFPTKVVKMADPRENLRPWDFPTWPKNLPPRKVPVMYKTSIMVL